MHGSSFVCGYVVCVVAWLSVVVQLVQILCFVPLGDRRIVDVVAVVSLPLPLSLFLFTFGASCMFIMLFVVRCWCFKCDWSQAFKQAHFAFCNSLSTPRHKHWCEGDKPSYVCKLMG